MDLPFGPLTLLSFLCSKLGMMVMEEHVAVAGACAHHHEYHPSGDLQTNLLLMLHHPSLL